MSFSQQQYKMKSNVIKITIIMAIIIFIIAISILVIKLIPGYRNTDICDMTNLIINGSNVTEYLKNKKRKVYVNEENIIYLSIYDIENFFDEYIYVDTKYNILISTYDTKVMELSLNGYDVVINGKKSQIKAKVIYIDGIMYIPFSEISEIYNSNIRYIKDYNAVIIDTFDKDRITAEINTNTKLKSRERNLSRTIENINKYENVMIINKGIEWSKIRTNNGKIGYVKNKVLENFKEEKNNINHIKQIEGNVNLVWDYYSISSTAPDRTGESIEGINVVSPSFFTLIKGGNGEIFSNIGVEGKKYIDWAHDNNYRVWPIISNDSLRDTTSRIMQDYKLRENLINNIVKECKENNIDGINIDFENMNKEDKELFSRFIIELEPRLKEIKKILSVDVTAPDGADTWSMCYDRNVIGDVADYIIFMAYDQYGESSAKAGTTSGYNWIKVNLNKFIKTEEILPEKIILGLPFYSRVWTLDENNNVIKNPTVSMKNMDKVIPQNVTKVWEDSLKQYVVEYKEDGYTKKIWIEDSRSFEEKLELITSNNLAGIATWRKDMEDEKIWGIINDEIMEKNTKNNDEI